MSDASKLGSEVYLRPRADGRWEIVDPTAGTAYACTIETAQLVVSTLSQGYWAPWMPARTPPDQGVKHWGERGWFWSLGTLMAGRRVDFVDSMQGRSRVETDAIRTEQVTRYQALDGPVPSRQPAHKRPPAPVDPTPDSSLGSVLRRRSCSEPMASRAINVSTIAGALRLGLLKTRRSDDVQDALNVLDSFGALFDIIVVSYAINDLSSGIHEYCPVSESITAIQLGEFRKEVSLLTHGHTAPLTAAATIVLVARFERHTWRYRHERALRNAYIEAGRLCGHLLVSSTLFGLRTHITPAIDDRLAEHLFGLRPFHHQALYALSVA